MFEKLETMYKEFYGWTNLQLDAVRLAIGCYLSPNLPGESQMAWGILIGAASSGKSTILRMFTDHPYTMDTDRLTRNALTSAYRDDTDPTKDFSLFSELSFTRKPEGAKVWVIQELSSIAATDPAILAAQMSDLRRASDGDHTTSSGMTGRITRKIGPFGILIGTTEAYEVVRANMAAVGDRFIAIRMSEPVSLSLIRAQSHAAWRSDRTEKAAINKKLREETHRILTVGLDLIRKSPTVRRTSKQEALLEEWAALYTVFASGPLATGMLTTAPQAPYRITEQVKSWGDTHAALCGRDVWSGTELRIARRLFRDSMPWANFLALRDLCAAGKGPNQYSHSGLYTQWSQFGAVYLGRPATLTDEYRDAIKTSKYME